MVGQKKVNSLAIAVLRFHITGALADKTVSMSCESGNYRTAPAECVSQVVMLQTGVNFMSQLTPPATGDSITLTEQTTSRNAARSAALWEEMDVAPWPKKIVLLACEALRQFGARDFDPFTVDGVNIVDIHPRGNSLGGESSPGMIMLRQHNHSVVNASLVRDLHPPQGNPFGGDPSANIPTLQRNAPLFIDGGSAHPHKIPVVKATEKTDPAASDEDTEEAYRSSGDIWPQKRNTKYKNGDEGFAFFTKAPPMDWFILLIACVVLFLFDYFVLQRYTTGGFRTHMVILCIWIFLAAVFNLIVWARMGSMKAVDWSSGYLLEWMLSMDNLFVFHLVFAAFKTPKTQIHKAVFVGIIGAVVMRMFFFMIVSTLLHVLHWVRFPFGVLLVYSGIEAARADDDEDMDLEDTRLVRVLRRILGDRLSETYDKSDVGAMFVYTEKGRLQVSMLLVVTLCLEVSDIMFALDSVSAKVAQIPDQYIAFSSSVIAMYGLRAMFFIVKDLVDMFDLLKYGLCAILVFIGIELMFAHYIKLSSTSVLVIIVAVFAVSICGSFAKKQLIPPESRESAMEDTA